MFPPKQLTLMVQVSNAEFDANSPKRTDESELLKFFGVIILITKCELKSDHQIVVIQVTVVVRPYRNDYLVDEIRHQIVVIHVTVVVPYRNDYLVGKIRPPNSRDSSNSSSPSINVVPELVQKLFLNNQHDTHTYAN